MTTNALYGVRIWLSGAVPPNASNEQRASILSFVRQFAATVFRCGGHIIHGSHPTFMPTLMDEADQFIKAGGRRDCLTLAFSRYWMKHENPELLRNIREICIAYETPEASGERARDDSLLILRTWMSERCDAFVAVGGNWWQEVTGRAGVPIEVDLAMRRGLPCFLLGGLGGAAKEFLHKNRFVLDSLKNGFDHRMNEVLATQEDVGSLVDTVCTQLTRLPLVHGRVSDGITFRILALDGGGVKGAFTASVLANLESRLGKPIAEHFDLIGGTSTGGILAVGLGMGLTPQEILKFYRERGSVIFPMTRFYRRWWRNLRQWVCVKHSREVLFDELSAAYSPTKSVRFLGESRNRLVIPAYDAISGLCHTFRTPHNPLLMGDAHTNAADVAMATAAAPTYFSAAKVATLVANGTYFDGGVWANCPVMASIVEAVCYLDVPLDRIDVLSIGTTDEPFTIKSFANSGILGWRRTMIDLLMNAQVDSTVSHARQLIGEPRFLRINVTTKPGEYALDNPQEIENLIALGSKKASDPVLLSQVKSRFLNGVKAIDWKIG